MTCSECGKQTDGRAVVTCYAQMDSLDDQQRFTGVVWCAECAPGKYKHLADDLEAVSLRAPRPR